MEKNNTQKMLWEYNTIFKENDEVYRCAAKTLGISDCSLWILYTLRTEQKAITQKEICEAFYYPKQTVNSALKKLENEGYIALTEMKDRRSKKITLTESGKKLAARTADKLIEAELAAMSELTDEEQKSFIELFRKYTGLLKKNMPH